MFNKKADGDCWNCTVKRSRYRYVKRLLVTRKPRVFTDQHLYPLQNSQVSIKVLGYLHFKRWMKQKLKTHQEQDDVSENEIYAKRERADSSTSSFPLLFLVSFQLLFHRSFEMKLPKYLN